MLSTRWLLVTLIGILLLSDQVVGHLFARPPQLLPLVEKYQQTRSGPHVVVFGTCLGDAMVPAVVEGEWSGQVHNLSFRGSTALEWYLILSRYIEDSPDLKAIVVVVGGNDLDLRSSPWESQILDLAAWKDIPALARDGCASPACALELVARKLSFTYRIRPFIALRLWNLAGTDMPGIPKAPIRGQAALINELHPSLPIEREGGGGGLLGNVPGGGAGGPGGGPGAGGGPGGPGAGGGPGGPGAGFPPGQSPGSRGPGQSPGMSGGPTGGNPPSQNENNIRGPGQSPGMSGGPMGGTPPSNNPQILFQDPKNPQTSPGSSVEDGWKAQSESIWFEKDASFWAKKLIAEARRRNIQVAFVPLPTNPSFPKKDWSGAVAMVQSQGAEWWEPGQVAGLGEGDFLDDVHFTREGLNKVAKRLGELLFQRL